MIKNKPSKPIMVIESFKVKVKEELGSEVVKINNGRWTEETAENALDNSVLGTRWVNAHADKTCGAYVPEHFFKKWK